MSSKNRAALLGGHDPVLVLEAASMVFADVENGRWDALVARLPGTEQRAVNAWRSRMAASGTEVATTPVHPIAILAATTLALGQSKGGPSSDERRRHMADLLVRIGLRFNADVIQERSPDPSFALASMSRSALWRAAVDENWMIWSGELVNELTGMPQAADVLSRFWARAGLSVQEWWYRGAAERATRAIHGAAGWRGTDQVDSRIEEAWARVTAVSVEKAADSAARALIRRRRKDPPTVANPYDLGWLAFRPVVQTADGRRFQIWLGANNRCLLPAGVAETVSKVTSETYLHVAELVGRAAERLLGGHVERLPLLPGEARIPEAAMPKGISKCDFLIELNNVLVGVEFTMSTPSRALSGGDQVALRSLVTRFADKFEQVYSSFQWRDPERRKRWLPLLVLVSPTVVDPVLNQRVHEELVARHVLKRDAPSELMTCHVPDFLDLVEYAETTGDSLAASIAAWRDGELRGASLDWWLSDRGAHRVSGRKRIGAVCDPAERILTSAATKATP